MTKGPAPQITTLPSGLRVVSHEMAHMETVSLGVWVAAGARHETAAENGISHMLEHMAFKGTARRNARAIAEEIEEVGGELNAATSLEMTAYYARVLKDDEGVALAILADILQNSSYAQSELDREREVILQEIAGIMDSPEELAYDLLQDAAFPDQPVGRPIIGTRKTVGGFQADELRRFLNQRYLARRTVVSAAGAIRHDALVRHVEAQFGTLNGGEGIEAEAARYEGGIRSSTKPFEQSHLLLGFRSPSYKDEDFLTAQVYSSLMGGGMSSRLFQEVREERGLCYSIYASAWGLLDGGLFSVHAATGAEMMGELIDVVSGVMRRSSEEEPSLRELDRAKAQLKAGLLMSLESSSARAEQMARHILVYGKLVSPRELIDRVDAVTPAQFCGFARKMLEADKPSITVVGAGKRSRHWAELAGKKLEAKG